MVAGSEIRDDPYHPVSRQARDLVAGEGRRHPARTGCTATLRFSEKLATPDTSIADLIGEVDPIKVAEGRYLSDELTLHYGLVPRSNRGIFAINELPDLAERIQVGLLNVLEERDVQIRGFTVRLPLDVVLVATANPEDYTNRGRIITPLKDRFGAQIRTHYPADTDTELAIVHQEARPPVERRGRRRASRSPTFMAEIVAELSQLARQSPHVNQRSGVSVRLSISNYETLAANAVRRALRLGEARRRAPRQRPRPLSSPRPRARSRSRRSRRVARTASCTGSSPPRSSPCSGAAARPSSSARSSPPSTTPGWSMPATTCPRHAYTEVLAAAARARRPRCWPWPGARHPGRWPAAIEFILEGLHLTKRLNKEAAGAKATYRGRG